MIKDQRTFYRELDSFLSQIDQGQKRKDFLNSVLSQLVSKFGEDLKISGGLIYVERIDGFHPALNSDQDSHPNLDPIAVEQIYIHKTYIFDQPEIPLFDRPPTGHEGTVPAAFIVGDREKRWILVVYLEPGWQREEIEFVLNVTRSMINHTVFFSSVSSDMDQAALIQQTLIPERVPLLPGFTFAARLISAESVGGDLYDFLTPDDNAVGLVIGDATGHGIPASLLARDVVTGLRMGIEKEMKMQPLIAKLNRVIHVNNLSSNFISERRPHAAASSVPRHIWRITNRRIGARADPGRKVLPRFRSDGAGGHTGSVYGWPGGKNGRSRRGVRRGTVEKGYPR
jgi:sigma-B regulation protein RsbU (phosphoserine phosphatase)